MNFHSALGLLRRPLPKLSAGPATDPRSLARDQRGSVAVIAAVAFPVLIGGIGLGAEVGYWYLKERKLQQVADLSAYAAAVRLNKGDEDDTLDEVALHIATQSGFKTAAGEIQVHHPPISGPNAGDDDMVEVVLTEDIERSFSGFFGRDDVNLEGRAVARVTPEANPACLIALAPTGAQTLSITGNGGVTLNSCVAVANSLDAQAIYVKGSGSLNSKCAYTGSGGAYGQKTDSIVSECNPEVQQDVVLDPYIGVIPPTKSLTCYTAGGNQPVIPVAPTRTVNGVKTWDLCALDIKSNLQLEAGVYILYGGNITDTGQNTVTGTGVTFFLTSKATAPTVFSRIAVNGAKFDLTAPTSGSYSGLVFLGDVLNTGTQSFGGNSNLQAQGAVRFPTGTIDFGGGSGSGGCVQLIANKISFTGNGDITFGHQCGGAGTTTANVGSGGGTVKLAE
ncbi:MAG: hypothetical protein H0T75_24835 [Rhizobiales bacterium]|nr:hypothetical protein [Hyphomicrobiales bacterium]